MNNLWCTNYSSVQTNTRFTVFCILMGHKSTFLNFNIFLFLKIVYILANSADPDEMPHNAAFHLGLHCLPKYLFICIQNEKGHIIGLIGKKLI